MSNQANRLSGAASPYLLQHAHNPVDWWPWGEAAFAEARRRDCPLFLSIGYATCHWCHVMERESFEDEAVAALLNQAFVCVKVDREERPDVDHVFMAVCQSLTGSGGWPLTLLLTPQGEPFFAGTYFPREGRGGRPGLLELIPRVQELWAGQRQRLRESAQAIQRQLTQALESPLGAREAPAPELVARGCARLQARFDARWGGFGRAPKFPTPHNLLLLLARGGRDAVALDMVRQTLLAMVRGGLHDQLGGGFHRYSTDEHWLLPHFEKMLYDQALLALALTETLERTPRVGDEAREGGESELRQALHGLLDYLLRDLRLPGGGFACGEDADSQGEEGLFYVWSLAELRARLSAGDLELIQRAWQLEEEGNWPDEGGGRATGRNIPHRARSWIALAGEAGLPLEAWFARHESIRHRLLEIRSRRVRPALDDKVLADWNGLAVAALARAAASPAAAPPERRAEWRRAAEQAAEFVLSTLRDESGGLLHRWHRGRAGIAGQLDDHAFLIWGLLELAAGPGGGRWLREALRLQGEQERLFRDPTGLYRMTRPGGDLALRPYEGVDGALPCGNSVSLHNLTRLGRLLDREDLLASAAGLAAALAANFQLDSGAHAWTLAGLQLLATPPRQLVLVGEAADPALTELLETARGLRGPGLELLVLAPGEGAQLGLARDRHEGRATAWLCDEGGCRPPCTDSRTLAGWLGAQVRQPRSD